MAGQNLNGSGEEVKAQSAALKDAPDLTIAQRDALFDRIGFYRGIIASVSRRSDRRACANFRHQRLHAQPVDHPRQP